MTRSRHGSEDLRGLAWIISPAYWVARVPQAPQGQVQGPDQNDVGAHRDDARYPKKPNDAR